MGLDSLLITEGIHRKELHEGEGGPLDAEGYRQFADDHGISPVYRMNRLVW